MKKRDETSAAKTRPATVDDYLAAAPADQRVALTRLRATIRAAAPRAVESFSYGMAGYKHSGRPLLYFAYWKDHLALYGNFDALASELQGYDKGKGTIRFPAHKPPSDQLVEKIVKARIADISRAG